MEPDEPRNVDGVIDAVARAMTSTELARDLRPGIASRLAARQPSWPLGWRFAAAGAAAAVMMIVALVMRSGEPSQSARVVDSVSSRPTVAPAPAPAPAPAEARASAPFVLARAVGQPTRRTGRQTIAPPARGIVEIPSLAIVPLEGDDTAAGTETPPQVVVIAPIDVEPVRISQLELVE